MRTTISVRHTDISDELKARAETVLDRLDGLSPHTLEATVVFDGGPLTHTAEIRLHVRGGKILIGTGEGPDHRTALDRAEAKIRPQLDRASFPKRARGSSPRP
jgi:ribosome-associated translation inhibitor RaiA